MNYIIFIQIKIGTFNQYSISRIVLSHYESQDKIKLMMLKKRLDYIKSGFSSEWYSEVSCMFSIDNRSMMLKKPQSKQKLFRR